MKPEREKIVRENTEHREKQLLNFMGVLGVNADELDNAIRMQFDRPWSALKASSKRGRFLAEQFLRCYNRTPDGNKQYQIVAWRSLFMPTEILYAMGIMPLTTEMVAAQLAMADRARGRLETAEANGFSQDICSFIRTAAGCVFEDLLPTPDILLTTSHLCDPSAKFAGYTSLRYKRPEFVIDIPYGLFPCRKEDGARKVVGSAIDYVASQLEEMVAFITEHTGLELDDGSLRKAIQQTNEARKWLLLGNALAYYGEKCVSRGSKELDYAANLMQTWGTEEIVDVYRSRFEEFVEQSTDLDMQAWGSEKTYEVYKNRSVEYMERARKGGLWDTQRPRVLWMHLKPYYPNKLLSYIEERADIVGSQVNYVYWDELDPGDPFRSIARKTLLHPGYCSIEHRARHMIELMVPGDAVIAFYPKSCRQFHSCARIESEIFKRAGIPMLTIDGDCIDNRGDDFPIVKTRIDRYLKTLVRARKSA